ncbi:MAG TPA: ribonuclease H family protein [Dysgonamonadaceae bacterium]|nr:ribonuclease H family protein [Dysgonamonadaceae bacterium]
MSKQKYYVVWHGKETGVFDSWDACKEQVVGFPGAKYKSFSSKHEAEKAYAQQSTDFIGKEKKKRELTKEEEGKYGYPIQESISVDGACNSKTGVGEYRGVYTHNAKEIFRVGPFDDGTNNIMEFLAIVHALGYCKLKGLSLPIYSDSRNAILWVNKKEVRTKQERTSKNVHLFDLIERAVKWIHENDYPNELLKWETKVWGEIPADFNRK